VPAASGTWRAYGSTNPTTSNWRCGTVTYTNPGVYGRACLIRASDGVSVQAAILVRNNNTANAGVAAQAYLQRADNSTIYVASCSASQAAPQSYSVCFGATITSNQFLWAGGFLNGVQVGSSSLA
jgi:hypothetical protein